MFSIFFIRRPVFATVISIVTVVIGLVAAALSAVCVGLAYDVPWNDGVSRCVDISAPSGSIDLTFTPFMERIAASDLWLVKSEVHQMFGYYNGTVSTVDGEVIPVQNLLGWAEDHVAKW